MPIFRPSRIPICLALLIVSVAAAPQVASAQATAPPPPPRQEGTAELAFVGTSGNSSTSTLSVGAEHIARPDKWVVRNRVLGVRSSSDQEVTAQSLLYLFRAERVLSARVNAFGDYGYFRDRPAGISSRNSVAGGLVFKIANGPRHTLSADAGLGYLDENRTAGTDISSATYLAGTAYKWALSETAVVTDDLRLLGTFDRSDDWRLAHIIAITARLTGTFSLKFSSTVRYTHVPPPGFKTTDTTTSVALVAGFKKQ
jgi:putative salt-induced outer membrane protein